MMMWRGLSPALLGGLLRRWRGVTAPGDLMPPATEGGAQSAAILAAGSAINSADDSVDNSAACAAACAADDACGQAVRRTYGELRARGVSDTDSFNASVRVLSAHHPELAMPLARRQAGAWIGRD